MGSDIIQALLFLNVGVDLHTRYPAQIRATWRRPVGACCGQPSSQHWNSGHATYVCNVQCFNYITNCRAKRAFHAMSNVIVQACCCYRDQRTNAKTKSQQHTSYTVICGLCQCRRAFECMFVVYQTAGADARASKAKNTCTTNLSHGS